MDAVSIFNFLLCQIENSPLNYAISKTPFSATISLKSSMSKRFKHDPTSNQEDTANKVNFNDFNQTLEDENNDLKQSLQKLKQIVSDQKVIIEEKFKQEKDASKTANDQMATFREEILHVKSEKKKINAQIKRIIDENKQLLLDLECLEKEASDLKTEAVSRAKTFEEEAKDFKKEKEYVENHALNLSVQLKALEQQHSKANFNFKCPFCDVEVACMEGLRNHVRLIHSRNKGNQIDEEDLESDKLEFCEYSCYYCGKLIISQTDLEEHRLVCIKIKKFTFHQCEICGAQCENESDLGRHRTHYHSLGTYSEEFRRELFWCDVCSIYFGSDVELQSHKIGFHHM